MILICAKSKNCCPSAKRQQDLLDYFCCDYEFGKAHPVRGRRHEAAFRASSEDHRSQCCNEEEHRDLHGRCRAAAVAVVSLAIGVNSWRRAGGLVRVAACTFYAAIGNCDTSRNALKASVADRSRDILGRASAGGGADVAFDGMDRGNNDGCENGDQKKLHFCCSYSLQVNSTHNGVAFPSKKGTLATMGNLRQGNALLQILKLLSLHVVWLRSCGVCAPARHL